MTQCLRVVTAPVALRRQARLVQRKCDSSAESFKHARFRRHASNGAGEGLTIELA